MTAPRPLAIVTGGSIGIGRQIVLTLAQAGWDVAFSYKGAAKEAAEEAGETERLAAAVEATIWHSNSDVGIAAEVDAFHDGVLAEFGRAADLLVNNAGVQTWAPLLELKEEDWDRVIRTNLKGTFLNTQAAARCMVAAGKGGSIINIGSGSNRTAFPRLVDYTASKGGIEMFTKVAAAELGEHGIRVNCVAPGAIEIERTRLESPGYAQTWAAITPLGRVGLPQDVANAVLLLAGAEAGFITGQTLMVDGGLFCLPNWPYRPGQ
jgi:NAD(P)-dependent dehydrogenase (short-subunit alcohol dehydrogenase family)